VLVVHSTIQDLRDPTILFLKKNQRVKIGKINKGLWCNTFNVGSSKTFEVKINGL